jgi:hypothetical protein
MDYTGSKKQLKLYIKTEKMKRHQFQFIMLVMIFTSFTSGVKAQDDTIVSNEPDNRPVLETFASGLLIETPTVVTPRKGGLELIIHHRMGLINDKADELFGIYAPSNIRLGLNIGVLENLTFGVGYERYNKMFDLYGKWAFLRQTRSGNIPVTFALYSNIVNDCRDKYILAPDTISYKYIHRLSYFNQLMVARKFTDWLTLQASGCYSHFNQVDGTKDSLHDPLYPHNVAGVSGVAKISFLENKSFLIEYDQPVSVSEAVNKPKPNLAFGFEIATTTHAFQVFATNYTGIVNQKNLNFNQNDFTESKWAIGFNITVRF